MHYNLFCARKFLWFSNLPQGVRGVAELCAFCKVCYKLKHQLTLCLARSVLPSIHGHFDGDFVRESFLVDVDSPKFGV